jgi:hypothetical protein
MNEIESTVEAVEREGGIEPVDPDTQDDIFITNASFEPRSVAVTKLLSENYVADKGIIYYNKEYGSASGVDQTNNNIEEIQSELESHCEDLQLIEASRLNQEKQFKSLKESIYSLPEVNGQVRVSIDSTTFTREILISILTLLSKRFQNLRARMLYVSTEEYGEWLSSGHHDTRNIIGYSGMFDQNKPTLLVILSGFETSRTRVTIEEHEPQKVLLGIGDPPTETGLMERNRQDMELVRARQETEEFTFPTESISKSFEVVNEIITDHLHDWDIVLSPMSTKPSTIGAWLAARKHMEVQVSYTIPEEYNTRDYSSGWNTLYSEEVPFDI